MLWVLLWWMQKVERLVIQTARMSQKQTTKVYYSQKPQRWVMQMHLAQECLIWTQRVLHWLMAAVMEMERYNSLESHISYPLDTQWYSTRRQRMSCYTVGNQKQGTSIDQWYHSPLHFQRGIQHHPPIQ